MGRFTRGRTWWGYLNKTPVDWWWHMQRRPLFGLSVLIGAYYLGYVRPFANEEARRAERMKQYWRADMHYQEASDWGSKEARDGMKAFIQQQTMEHGSFENAIKEYEKRTGKKAPAFCLEEPVLDYVLKRVGVPIEGPDEPNFLYDGTPWTVRKPQTTPDGKRPSLNHRRITFSIIYIPDLLCYIFFFCFLFG